MNSVVMRVPYARLFEEIWQQQGVLFLILRNHHKDQVNVLSVKSVAADNGGQLADAVLTMFTERTEENKELTALVQAQFLCLWSP